MTTSKNTPEPGPKPDFLVVEDHLKCQTNEGEKSLDLRVPLRKIELFMEMEDVDIPQSKMPRYIIDNVLSDADKTTIDDMLDGAKALKIVMEYVRVLGDRMGADLGESSGSTGSSGGTGEPSATTSDTASQD